MGALVAYSGLDPRPHDSGSKRGRRALTKRGPAALRKLLWKNGVLVHAHDTGGVQTSRTMWVDVTTGEVTLKINGAESKL